MDPAVSHFSTVLIAFFAIMNPIANAPIFLGVTEDLDTKTTRAIALRSVLYAFLIITAFTVCGREIFKAFSITLPAFRIAGGILIGLVGYHLLQGNQSAIHSPAPADATKNRDAVLGVAVSPLAIPVLAGPGTIATAMSFAAESTVPEISRVVGAMAVVCLVTAACFIGSRGMVRFLGQNVINVIGRLMGLILAVIGVQMVIDGVRGAVAATGS